MSLVYYRLCTYNLQFTYTILDTMDTISYIHISRSSDNIDVQRG